jgi:hypothetical protein
MQTQQTTTENIKPPSPDCDQIIHNDPAPIPFKRQPWWDPATPDRDAAAADILAVVMGLCQAHPERILNGEIEITESLLSHFASAARGTVHSTLVYLVALGLIAIRPSPDCKFRLNKSDKAYWIGPKPYTAEMLDGTTLEVPANTASKSESPDEATVVGAAGNSRTVPKSQSPNHTPK